MKTIIAANSNEFIQIASATVKDGYNADIGYVSLCLKKNDASCKIYAVLQSGSFYYSGLPSANSELEASYNITRYGGKFGFDHIVHKNEEYIKIEYSKIIKSKLQTSSAEAKRLRKESIMIFNFGEFLTNEDGELVQNSELVDLLPIAMIKMI